MEEKEIIRRDAGRLQIVGGSAAPKRAPKQAQLNAKLDKLQSVALTLMQEIKSLSVTPSKIDVTRGVDFYEEVRRFEADLIRQALILTDGHQGRAARLLGLGVTTLNSIIKRYGISPHDPARDPFGGADEESAETAMPQQRAAGDR